MLSIIKPLSFIYAAVVVNENALAIGLIVGKFTLVDGTIVVGGATLAVLLVVLEAAFVFRSVYLYLNT